MENKKYTEEELRNNLKEMLAKDSMSGVQFFIGIVQILCICAGIAAIVILIFGNSEIAWKTGASAGVVYFSEQFPYICPIGMTKEG